MGRCSCCGMLGKTVVGCSCKGGASHLCEKVVEAQRKKAEKLSEEAKAQKLSEEAKAEKRKLEATPVVEGGSSGSGEARGSKRRADEPEEPESVKRDRRDLSSPLGPQTR